MDKIFWTDSQFHISYKNLINEINSKVYGKYFVREKSTYMVFVNILHSMVNDYPIMLLDGDFSEAELANIGISIDNLNKEFKVNKQIETHQDIINLTENLKKWHLILLTSGTTGLPKKVEHSFFSISKAVKVSNIHENDVWGFAYNPTHMAGIQVFLQAFMNGNHLVDLFKKSPNEIVKLAKENKITHLSATPTFYRLFLNDALSFPNLKQISSGGEKMSESLKRKLNICFPNAKIRNIYASTEAGSLFASDGENFKISERFNGKIKIIENEILIHASILGKSDSLQLDKDWYHTGDLVEIIDEKPQLTFRFLSRKNAMVNVGGFKVNPHEVEEALLKIPQVTKVKVFGKSNPVLGQILMADVVAENITEKEIRSKLCLQKFKIPRIINFVKNVELTRTGKVKR